MKPCTLLRLLPLVLAAVALPSCQSISGKAISGADPLDGPTVSTEVYKITSSPDRMVEQRFHEQHYQEALGDQATPPVRGTAGVSSSMDW